MDVVKLTVKALTAPKLQARTYSGGTQYPSALLRFFDRVPHANELEEHVTKVAHGSIKMVGNEEELQEQPIVPTKLLDTIMENAMLTHAMIVEGQTQSRIM